MAEEDLIFGKNRHFFGGIEPSTMRAFNAIRDTTVNKIKIEATLPANTVIDGQTLCTVAGAIIRRKATDYPKDEFDGDLVGVISSTKTFYDESADVNGTYYYAAFPYTTQGVYSRNKANRAVANEPLPMVMFSLASIFDSSASAAKIRIIATLPAGAAGAVIRRSTVGFPENETDGDEVMTITSSGTYEDTNVVLNTKYYYSAFPYTKTGAYNRSPSNRAACVPSKYKYLYGYDINLSDSNPATRVSYPSDVDNSSYTAAKMNFGGSFSYGGWTSTPGEKFMPRPCMLKYDGTVGYYLNPNDYSKKADGSASDVANVNYGGNAMMEWPKIYTKRWTENGVYHFRCSDIKMDNGYECWCNYDKNNKEIDHFYTPIYFGSKDSSERMRSISGQANWVTTGGAQAEIAAATKNGANSWYTEVLADRLLIQDLLVMISKNTDSQAAFGYGVVSTSAAIAPGQGNAKGMFWGSNDKTSVVKVFGMENWWGNLWRRTAGWILNNGVQKVKLTRGTKDGTTANDYNLDGAGYLSPSGTTISGSSGGYIKSMKAELYGRLPFDLNGSSSTYEPDSMWFNASDVRYAFVGGYYDDDLAAGSFCVLLGTDASASHSGVGAALSCKPLA